MARAAVPVFSGEWNSYHEEIAQMGAAVVVGALAGIVLLGYAWLSLIVIFMLLYGFAYWLIRRRGYFPPAATAFVLGVGVTAILITLSTVRLLPTPTGASEIIGVIFVCIILPGAFSAGALALLVRTLPRRNVRVFGQRQVQFPFVFLGYLMIAGAIAVGFAVPWLAPPENATVDNYLRLLVVVVVIAGSGLQIIKTGKRLHSQGSIEEETRRDLRPPVLFLRPFAAERTPFVQGPDSRYGQYASGSQQWLTWLRTLHDNDGNQSEEDPTISIPFEHYLGATFRERIGPFIALGNPEDYLPPEGAIRTYAEDEGWYEYFERIAGQCACMVMPVSNSDNLERELTFLRRAGLQQRLFIVMSLLPAQDARVSLMMRPAVLGTTWIVHRLYGFIGHPQNRLNAGLPSWRHLAEHLGQLGYDLGEDPGLGAVVTFDAQGKAIVPVTGAQQPLEFVEPIREYLMSTFGFGVGEVASIESTNPLDPAPTPASVRAPSKSRVTRFLETKYAGWMFTGLFIVFTVAYASFHMWQLNRADSLFGQGRYAEAAYYFQKAANSGNTGAMTRLGYMYETGLGVATSQEKAAALYREAVSDEDRPNSQAMVNLALMYLDGRGGLKKDEMHAVELCRRATDADNANAMFLLGIIYEDGLGGLPKDATAALDWYKKAAARGNEAATKRLNELQNSRGETKKE